MPQPMTTSARLYTWSSGAGIHRCTFSTVYFSIITISPKYTPQMMKFHEAPCHMPVRNHTTRMFHA